MHGRIDPDVNSKRRLVRRPGGWLVVAWICFVAGSSWMQQGGCLHPESRKYLIHWLGTKPLLAKLYDSRSLETEAYQARELSYLFDGLDAHAIAASIRAGFPHFLSLTTYLFALLIGWVAFRFCVRDLALDGFASLCLILLFWTGPSVFLWGLYFRSAKIGVALMTALAFPVLYRYDASGPRRCLGLFFLALAASLFDRQGVYLVGLGAAFLAVKATRNRRAAGALLALVAALAAASAYNRRLAPHLTFLLNGYWPNAAFQHFSLTDLPRQLIAVHDPVYDGSPLLDGMALLLDTCRFMLGNLSPAVAAVFLAGIAVVLARGVGRTAAVWFVGLLLAIVFMNALMVIKHPAVTWPDVRRFYYWVPTATLLLFATALALRAARGLGVPWVVLRAGLVLLLFGNLAALPAHWHALEIGHLQSEIASTPGLLRALRDIPDRSTGSGVGGNATYRDDPIYQLALGWHTESQHGPGRPHRSM